MEVTLKMDDRDEFILAINGPDLYSVLWDIDNYLRKRVKHEDLSDDAVKVLQEVRDELLSLMAKKGLYFDMVQYGVSLRVVNYG